ncbi:hypothetical protein GN958_ATG04189 [Phytophthora infestans]|uniref:Uncharacterized protein n=1 Tax=Phytophthora infestans TaxID=4787 RepID=A0A8S9V5B8_PHYIN|nr:hypothetical protein GN958_ATG04189 [Phytophthora infestans]
MTNSFILSHDSTTSLRRIQSRLKGLVTSLLTVKTPYVACRSRYNGSSCRTRRSSGSSPVTSVLSAIAIGVARAPAVRCLKEAKRVGKTAVGRNTTKQGGSMGAAEQKKLPVRELDPGHPRDRRVY